MSKSVNEHGSDLLPALRDHCSTLALDLERETDPLLREKLSRELAECRQRVFEVEEAERPQGGYRPPGVSTGAIHPANPIDVQIVVNSLKAADHQPDYAGLHAAERIENSELRAELVEAQGQGISRERERLHPSIAYAQEQIQASELQHAGIPPELLEAYKARTLGLDESFSGEVVHQVENGDDLAFVIEADGDRVMVPRIESVEIDVGDDLEVSRDYQETMKRKPDTVTNDRGISK